MGAGAVDRWSLDGWTVRTGASGDRIELLGPQPATPPDLLLIGPVGQRLAPGTLTELRAGNGYDEAVGGLRYWAHQRACSAPLGSVAIDAISWQGGVLERVDLRFTSSCEPGMPPAFGTLSWAVGTAEGAPPAPSGVTATGGATPSVRWSGVPGATGYRVTTYVDGTARPAVQVGAAVGTTTAPGVAPGGRVRFEVQAVGSAGAGPRSASSMVAVARAPGARGVVARMYLDVLGRRASERELDGWSARVRAGWTTARVGSAIRRSDEALRREADATYLAGAARLATPAERDSWLRSRRSGSSIARLRSIVLTGLPAPTGSTAPEVDSRWLDDVSFAVGQVHPTQTDEAEGCGPDRQRGLIRIGCADRIQRTVPVRAAIVRQQFASLLGREPDAAGRRYWLAKLASGTPEEDLTIGLLASTEYARRAGA